MAGGPTAARSLGLARAQHGGCRARGRHQRRLLRTSADRAHHSPLRRTAAVGIAPKNAPDTFAAPVASGWNLTFGAPSTAAMILSGSAVHVKRFGSALVSARKRLMASWRSTTNRKTPRFSYAGQLGEVALDGIEPGGRGRREVEDEALMPVEPSADLGMLVGARGPAAHGPDGIRPSATSRNIARIRVQLPTSFPEAALFRTIALRLMPCGP